MKYTAKPKPFSLMTRMKSSRQILTLFLIYSFVFPYLSWAVNPSILSAKDFASPPTSVSEMQVPAHLGTITSSFAGASACVVLIQDLHCQYEVQKNISNLIHYLAGRHGLKLVGEEGAFGRIRTDRISTFPIPAVREAVSDYFVKQGKLSGAEFCAINSRYPVRLEGVETPELYQASEKAVRTFLNQESLGLCQDLKEMLDALKPAVYQPRLQRFDAVCQAFHAGRLNLKGYGAHILEYARQVRIEAAYPRLGQLVKAADQREADPEDLGVELRSAERDIRERLYVSGTERTLDNQLQHLALIERLLNISATVEDLQALRSRPKDYTAEAFLAFLQTQASGADVDLASELGGLNSYIRDAAAFYALADQRSLRFVDNMLGKMQATGESLAAMITGGFHTPDIQRELQRRNISYVTIRPTRTGPDTASPYFELLQNRRTALEKLLAESQLSLALRTLLVDSEKPTSAQKVFGDQAELYLETLAAVENPDLAGVLSQYPQNSPVGVTVRSRFSNLQIFSTTLKARAEQVCAIISRHAIHPEKENPLDSLQLAGWNIAFVTAAAADRQVRANRQGARLDKIRSWFDRLRALPVDMIMFWTKVMELKPVVINPRLRWAEREIILQQMRETPQAALERTSPLLLHLPFFILVGGLALYSPAAAAGLLLLLQPAGLLILDGHELWKVLRSKPWKLRLANYNPLALTSNNWILTAQFFDGLIDLYQREGSIAAHAIKLLDAGCVLIGACELFFDLVLDQVLGTRRFAKKTGLIARAFRTHSYISPLKNISTAMDGLVWSENGREEQYCLYSMLHLLVFEDFRDIKLDQGKNNFYGAGDIYAYRLMKKCGVFEFGDICAEIEQRSPWLREIASRPMQVQLNPWQRFIINQRIMHADPELHSIGAGRLSVPDQQLERILYQKYGVPIQATQELLRIIDLNRPVSAADLLGEASKPVLQALLAAGILERTEKSGAYQLSQHFETVIRPLQLRQQLSAVLDTPVRPSEVEPWFRGGFRTWVKNGLENHGAARASEKSGAPKTISSVADRFQRIVKPLSKLPQLMFRSMPVFILTTLANAEDMNRLGAHTAVDIFWQALHAGVWMLGLSVVLIAAYSIWWELTRGRSLKAAPVNEGREFLARALRETGLLQDSMKAVYGPDMAEAAQKTSYRIEPLVVSGHRMVYRVVFIDPEIPPLIAKVQKDREGLDAEVKLMQRINQQSSLRGIRSPVVPFGVHAKLPSPHRFLTGDIITLQYAGEHGLDEFLRSDFNPAKDKLLAVKNSAASLMAMHGLCGMIPRDYDRVSNYRLNKDLASQIIDVGIADKYIFRGLITRPGVGMKVTAAELQQLLTGPFAEAAARAGRLHLEDVRRTISEAIGNFSLDPDWPDPNVSCGTICRSGHEGSRQALDEQLQRVYADMASAYHRIPGMLKQEVREKLRLDLRELIPEDGILNGPEADLAQSVMGYLTQEEFEELQKLRETIRQSPEYQKARSLGKDIDILFVRPESGKELFWHDQDYAAGHFNQAGTRIHISLPVVLDDLERKRTPDTKAPADALPSLAEKIAEHELKHIADKQHDPSLDSALAEIAQRDQKRTAFDVGRIHSAQVPEGMRLDMARLEENLYPFVDLAELQAAVESNGWQSLMVKMEHLPEDLKLLWQTLPLHAGGESDTWWELLKFGGQEVMFAPYLMGYSQVGGKVTESLSEALVQPEQPEDGRLPQTEVLLVASTHYPSDALYTGRRIRPRNLLETSRLLARGTGKLAIQKLVNAGKLGPEYLRAAELERLSYLSERQFLLDLQTGLRGRTLESEIMAGLGDPADAEKAVESWIKETERKIRQLNYQLRLPPQILEFSKATEQALRSALSPDQAAGPVKILQPGSAGWLDNMNRELEGIFLELRDAYNRLVSRDIKDYARVLGLSPRQNIREQELVGELEADVANAFLGYMPLRHHPALQQLRSLIRSLPEYKRATETLGGHIGIYFLRPGGTELFWVDGEPAAAHVRHDGSEVILPLPLALYAIRHPENIGGFGLENSLVVRLARRELKRISDHVDDRSLDREVREIAKLDKARQKGQLKNLLHFNLGPEMRLETAEILEWTRPVTGVKVLNQNIQEAGYRSLALPAAKIPEDLSGLLQAISIPAAGASINFRDLLLETTDEIIFTPHAMLYSERGLRLEENLIENELAGLMRQYGQDLRPGKRVMIVETVYPSGALLTGERIAFKDSWELLLSVLTLTGDRVLEQLLPAGQLAAEDQTYAKERERTELALKRLFLTELKQLILKPQSKAARKLLQKHRSQEINQFLDRMRATCEEEIAKLNSALGVRANDFALPEALARKLAELSRKEEDPNVSCGTICQSGHEGSRQALDEQLHRVYADMIAKYNELVPEAAKRAVAGFAGLQPRGEIRPDQQMTEGEADLALVSSGYATPKDMAALQALRERIKAHPDFRLRRMQTGKDIEIFFTRPETGSELFWVGKDYAAGHFNGAGTRMHISLPLALEDAYFFERTQPAEARDRHTLTEAVARHEFLHIIRKAHDPTLDAAIREIARRDQARLKIPYPRMQSINTTHGLRVDLASISEYLQPIKHTPELQRLLRQQGWKSLAVPVADLPLDIRRALEKLPVPGIGKTFFWDLLKYSLDEIVFCPYLMAYGGQGQKALYSIENMVFDSSDEIIQKVRVGRRFALIPALLPNDSILTGTRLKEKGAVDLLNNLGLTIGNKILPQLVSQNDLDPDYVNNFDLHEKTGYAFQRLLVLALIQILEQHDASEGKWIKNLTAGQDPRRFADYLRTKTLPAIEGNIAAHNQKLGLPENNFEVSEVLEAIGRNVPPGAVSERLRNWTNRVRSWLGLKPMSGSDYARRAWWIENLWVAAPAASAILAGVMLASGNGAQAWDLLASAVFQPQMLSWVRIISLGAWGSIFLGSHVGGNTPRKNLARAGLVFAAIAGLHFLPITLAGVYLAAFAVHRIVNFNQDQPGQNSLEIRIERTRRRLLGTRGSA